LGKPRTELMKPLFQSRYVRHVTGEEILQITILKKLLLTLGQELLGKFASLGFDPILLEQIHKVDEIV